MTKAIKWVSLGVLGIVFYTFAGMMTYRYHEMLYPGATPDTRALWPGHETHGHELHNPNVSKGVGVLWPIGLPITLGLHAARLVK